MTTKVRTEIAPNQKKLKELILYISERCAGDSHFGRVKLNKIMFYSDFLSYASLGKPITGVAYSKMANGPVPKAAIRAWTAMESNDELVEVHQQAYGFTQKRIMARRASDVKVFTGPEISIIEQVIAHLEGKTAKQTSDLSHLEYGWKVAGEGEEIPYETVFVSWEKPTAADSARVRELASQHQW
jgi:hypothetical protein